MEVYRFRDVTFAYPGCESPALSGLSFDIAPGEFLLICGASGCGKTTLLRHLKTCLTPAGAFSGEILFDGTPLSQVDARTQAYKIGFVLQSPENQGVCVEVCRELAFGLENLGLDASVIRRRVAEVSAFFGIESLLHSDVSRLSGGQKQILNLASVMAMQPDVLVLDEPTAQLDPISAEAFFSLLGKINRDLGVTVILSEHRPEEVFAYASRVLVMQGGKLLYIGTPGEVGEHLHQTGNGMMLAMPAAMRVRFSLDTPQDCPVTVRQGRQMLTQYACSHALCPLPPERPHTYDGDPVLTAEDLHFRYEKDAPTLIRGLSLSIRRGELFALLGGNGTGKTTLLRLLAGHLSPERGQVRANGRLALCPQDPKTLFVRHTVRQDLADVARTHSLSADAVQRVVKHCRLEPLLDRHPYDLSGGEQQKAALAKILLTKPDILLLDEPTKGLDAQFKVHFAAILRELTQSGVAVVLVSHDLVFCAEYAHRCALLFDGALTAQGTAREFFGGNSFYTTPANRMARHLCAEAVTVADVIALCGGKPEPPVPEDDTPPTREDRLPPPASVPRQKPGRRAVLAMVLPLISVPLTVCAGVLWGHTNLVALAIVAECLIAFFLMFERRRPQARELVTAAVLCALGIAGRSLLFMLPQFKPVLALTILVGAAFGSQTGFLVGAVTMLASNILFSQGPWTPWQMLAMGLPGFLAGILFRRKKPNAWLFAVFGAFCAVFIYGAIMNFSSAVVWNSGNLTLPIVLSYFAAGLSMDLIHAVSTAFFLAAGAKPILEKFTRIQTKYGLYQ